MRAIRPPLQFSQCLRRRATKPLSRPFTLSAAARLASVADPQPTSDAEIAASRAPTVPKPAIDLKHIRQNAEMHAQNCRERNYASLAGHPARIVDLHAQWTARQYEGRALRERSNTLRRHLANPPTQREEEGCEVPPSDRKKLLDEARSLKSQLADLESSEAALKDEIDALALALPNVTSEQTPRGDEPRVLSYINDAAPAEAGTASDAVWRSHVHIGTELGILDFAGAGAASGWGWYYLVGAGAQLEAALVAYALAAATRADWTPVSPPTVVYAHIAAACGFQPRDQHGETQIYGLAQSPADRARGRPELVLAATAEIPLAGMKAGAELPARRMPLRRAAASRCFRAEAGARGVDTKGLYRVHEFTKVELFAWTRPAEEDAADVFDELVDLQTDILQSLGLRCRVLEMPSGDLGASASRKCDIEAFFPSRRALKDGGWGEVTSASVCTDYQTRRLGTRVRLDGKAGMTYPWTVNGTALAVPRVLAAILENGWNEEEMSVSIPECLWPWMDGREKIGLEDRR